MKKLALLVPITAVAVALALFVVIVIWPQFLDSIIFIVSASVAVTASVLAVTRQNPLYGILALLAVMLSVSGIFYVLAADLLAVLNLLVYGGAVLMLFLFVIMLFDLGSPDPAAEGDPSIGRESAPQAERRATGVALNTPKARALGFSILLGVFLIAPILKLGSQWDEFLPNSNASTGDPKTDERIHRWLKLEFDQMSVAEREAFQATTPQSLDMTRRAAEVKAAREAWDKISADERAGKKEPPRAPKDWPGFGQPDRIGMDMFEYYLIPFEFVSLIILAGIVGAVVLARRKATDDDHPSTPSAEPPGAVGLVHPPLPPDMEPPKPKVEVKSDPGHDAHH